MEEINRRKFVKNSALATLGFMVADSFNVGKSYSSTRLEMNKSDNEEHHYNIMQEVNKYRKIDAHAHIYTSDNSPELQLQYGERLRIEKQVVSRYLGVMPGTPEQFRAYNDTTINIIRKHPDRMLGGFVLNPIFQRESLDEIERCVDQGMIGPGELYYQVKINDPLYYPIIERMIDLNMIIHSHAECQIGVGGYRMKYNGNKQPNTSTPEDFVDIAARYPEGIFQFAHIGGGGDWEYMCKMLQNSPNVFVDTSGSNNSEGMIDFAVKYLGEDRLFYASDNSYYQSIAAVLASNLSEKQIQKIFFDNYNNVLKKGGRNVN